MGKSSPQLSISRRELKNDDNGNSKKRKKTVGSSSSGEMAEQRLPVPLSEVVSDCRQRWFEDTLKEAKSGEINMQVLVGQMYTWGYGVPQDLSKGTSWIARAAAMKPWAWKVINKRPGYNPSDSDSDTAINPPTLIG